MEWAALLLAQPTLVLLALLMLLQAKKWLQKLRLALKATPLPLVQLTPLHYRLSIQSYSLKN